MNIQRVPINFVPQVLPSVRSHIERGLEFTDSCSVDHACAYLVTGAWTLLVAVVDEEIQGAYVLSFSNTPTERTALIVSAAGAGLASQDAFDQVKEIAREQGATQIQVLARESAARLYKRVGLTEKATLMEIKL
jgi:hypothetical protein